MIAWAGTTSQIKSKAEKPELAVTPDSLLNDNPLCKREYQQIMRDLKAVFYNKVRHSDPGDTLLLTAPDDPKEAALFDRLAHLYGTYGPAGSGYNYVSEQIEATQKKLFEAAKTLKPAYDQWHSQHPPGPQL